MSPATASLAALVSDLRVVGRSEKLSRLVDALQTALSTLHVSIDPPEDPSWLMHAVHLRVPVNDFYGQICKSTWAIIETVFRGQLGRDVADEALGRAVYHLEDSSGRRLGSVTRLENKDGKRDYLDNQPLYCGDGLELLGGNGSWIGGRYEMAVTRDQHALFYPHLWSGSDGVAFTINEQMILRRPGSHQA